MKPFPLFTGTFSSRSRLHGTVCALALAAVLAPTERASAQADASDGSTIETIMVTAQRRSENMQRIPIAVTAVTGDSLKKTGIQGTYELSQRVPGLTIVGNSGSSAQMFLRGVGTGATGAGGEPAIANYIDDIYQPSAFAGFRDYSTITSIEVYKGPQGTLFGRNATGGVISIRTRDPSLDLRSVDVNLGYENFNKYNGEIYVSTPITKKLAFNIVAKGWRQEKGWGTNLPTGNPSNLGEGWGTRTKLLWEPGDRTRVVAAGNFDYQSGSLYLYNRIVPGIWGRGDFKAENTYPGISFWDTTSLSDGNYHQWSWSGSLKVDQDFNAFKFVSISAYSKTVATFLDVNSATTPQSPSFFQNYNIPQIDVAFTQEFQLQSPEDSELRWVLGAFYMQARSEFIAGFAGTAFTSASGTGFSDVDNVIQKHSYAGFGQATANILPKTKLTAGLRYTIDQSRLTGRTAWNRIAPLTPILGGPFQQDKNWYALTGRLALDHDVTDNILVYTAYNRGFKSGLYNSSAISPSPAPLPASPPAAFPAIYAPANPEQLDAYTVGLKSTLLDGALRFNIEGFYYSYQNIQFQITVPGGTAVSNAASAKIKGVDLEATYIPVRNLTLTMGLSVQQGKYGAFSKGLAPAVLPWGPNTPIPIPAGCPITTYPVRPAGNTSGATAVNCDFNGNKTVKTPPVSVNIALDYHVPLDNSGALDFSVSWARTGNYYMDVDNNPLTKQAYYNVVNTSAKWSSPNDRFDIRLFARNLTNEEYFAAAAVGTTAVAKYAPGAPRTYGVNLGFHL